MAVPTAVPDTSTKPPRTPWYRQLYAWVLIAIVAGIAVGLLWPSAAVNLEPLGTTFVAAIKMIITPIILLTVVSGIAGAESLRRVGRVGLKALLYFEAVS